MKNIKFLKEPGYVYGLFFVFVLNFNKDFCLTNFINYNKSNEDTEYFTKILSDYASIPDDLFPFFYLKQNGKCFMTQYYYEPYMTEFTTAYNLRTVQTELTNYNQVISNLIKYYFLDISDEILLECKNSFASIGQLIKNSKYDETVKCSLYALFLEPIPAIQKLSYELMTKGFQFAQHYEKNYKSFMELQSQIDLKDLSDRLKLCKNYEINIDAFKDIYISICPLFKNCIKTHFYDDKAVLLLGIDYDNYLEYLIFQNRLPPLDTFGNAISENNRIDILDLIFRKNEISIKDIEQELGFTATNAYYHLSLMIKANIIKSRNQGRMVLYSINKCYFDVVCGMLNKYSNNPPERR